MPSRHSITRRDVILLLLGVSLTRLFTPTHREIVVENTCGSSFSPDLPPPETHRLRTPTTTTTTVLAQPSPPTSLELAPELPPTSLVAHAPGWTLFKNLYMSNGTFYIATDREGDFPRTRFMASNPLPAINSPENIALREPTELTIAFISSAEAQRRWGGDIVRGERHRVLSVDGNTVLVNEPGQFLAHYYHLVAELFFGVQAFWHGAHTAPSFQREREYMLAPEYSGSAPAPPPIARVIFARADAAGWRDRPGFNAYFLRAAFPGASVEAAADWDDRVAMTRAPPRRERGEEAGDGRAWHFPLLLLTDRSAAHRGRVCGSETQRIAAEAFEGMRAQGTLVGARVGGWWAPVRTAVLRFAGAEVVFDSGSGSRAAGAAEQAVMDGDGDVAAAAGHPPFELALPKTIVITYVSRQLAGRRTMTQESHAGLIAALEGLVARKGTGWELQILVGETLSKDEQLRMAARTTFMVGVHGNGLTHLVMMQPNRLSTVIEIFYPQGYAHDYQWTSKALGMKHIAVWNDTFRMEGVGEGKPHYAYPEGFQGDAIPVHGPTVVQLIEDRVEGRL